LRTRFPDNKAGCAGRLDRRGIAARPDRLTTPLMRDRKGGVLREASWDER